MSKPMDPVLRVIDYFEGADMALAKQTLAIVQRIMARRGLLKMKLPTPPGLTPAKPAPKGAKREAPVPGPVEQVG